MVMRVYFEGMPDFEFKMFKIYAGISSDELREMVASKLHVDPNSFWIYLQKDEQERSVGAGEYLLTDPSREVVTVKLVAGSHYYVCCVALFPRVPCLTCFVRHATDWRVRQAQHRGLGRRRFHVSQEGPEGLIQEGLIQEGLIQEGLVQEGIQEGRQEVQVGRRRGSGGAAASARGRSRRFIVGGSFERRQALVAQVARVRIGPCEQREVDPNGRHWECSGFVWLCC